MTYTNNKQQHWNNNVFFCLGSAQKKRLPSGLDLCSTAMLHLIMLCSDTFYLCQKIINSFNLDIAHGQIAISIIS